MDKILKEVAIGLLVFVVLEILINQKAQAKSNKNSNSPSLPNQGKRDNPQYVFEEVADTFGKGIARNVERMYRLETANFTSGQYRKGRSAGMHAHGKSFPYGWTSVENMWLKNPTLAPVGFDDWEKDSGGYKVSYLVFPNLYAGAFALATFLEKYKNNPGRWFSTDPASQRVYNKKVEAQPVKYA